MATTSRGPRHFAVIGAGIAGITCARTLVQAGHSVTVFEKSPNLGGRMATRSTLFGSFDHGVQYFTVRDPRFAQALATVPGVVQALECQRGARARRPTAASPKRPFPPASRTGCRCPA